jgi:hypothetical protein
MTSPQQIKVKLNNLVNPNEAIRTDSFKIETKTEEGYSIDLI